MIKINRPPEPSYFSSPVIINARNEIEKQATSGNQGRLKFNTSVLTPIKKDLLAAFNNKCAYCEARLEIGGFSHADTFRPKNGSRGLDKEFSELHYYWLAYEWENLYASCSVCNKNKYNVFPVKAGTIRASIGARGEALREEANLLIDPCNDNPEEYLDFKPDGTVAALHPRGQVTIDLLKLNRQGLVDERKRAAEALTLKLQAGFSRKKALQTFQDELFSDRVSIPYAAVQRAVFRAWESAQDSEQQTRSFSSADIQSKSVEPPPFQFENISRQLMVRHFGIRRIEISNFKNIGYLDLEVLPSETDQESWLLLLGDNGTGKSSILQAIALALCGEPQVKLLNILPGNILRDGEVEGYVRVFGELSDEPVELRFNRTAFTAAAAESVCFVLAYGATRLPPEGVLKGNIYEQDYVNIGNLFYYTVALTDVNQWIATLPDGEFPRIASALYDLLDMKEGDRVVMEDQKLKLYFADQGSFIGRSSDGYRSMVALACDIMRTLSLDNASYHSTSGIVMLDEMGNHLHPRWRMKVVTALRNAFPLLQFIVSTHEPLCLRGLKHGEVVVLVRDRENEIRALDKKMLPDHTTLRIDQLLTSDFFGLINTLDPEAEKRYEDYYALLAKPEQDRLPGDTAKIAELSQELAGKDLVGSTPQLQVLYQVVNETYAKNLREEDFKTRTELSEKTVSQVKTWLDDQHLDWL